MIGTRIWKLDLPLSPASMVISTNERYSQNIWEMEEKQK